MAPTYRSAASPCYQTATALPPPGSPTTALALSRPTPPAALSPSPPQLARTESELLAAELADTCPATGWPAPPAAAYLARPGLTAPWQPQPPAQPQPHQPQHQPSGPDDEGPDAPEDVALIDPVAGALQMGLLQRARCGPAARWVTCLVCPWAVVRAA